MIPGSAFRSRDVNPRLRRAKRLLAFTLFALVLSSPLAAASIEIGGGKIDVDFQSSAPDFPRPLVAAWVTNAARAVTKYYGRFPVDHVVVRIREVAGGRIDSGRTVGRRDGSVITVSVGRSTTAAHFNSDWLMTHEMVHLAFPNLPDEHHWIEEGLATYVEPIARVRIGNLRAQQAWADVVRDLPQGLPQSGDRGLDHTPTWGRTYWGGALFCLLADVEIRRRTGNAKGLEDALRGILEAGGSISADWDIGRALQAGDRATGVAVLQELYSQMKAAPHPVDLDQLWKQLGIEPRGPALLLHDDAPLAAVRKAIMPE